MAVLEVYADVWCPFAHVGLRAVVARRRAFGREDVGLRVRSWPLELVNGSPLDPERTAGHVAELRAQVAPDLFAGFDAARFPATSLPALAEAVRAYRVDLRTGEAVSLALRDALFEEGLDVSDPVVLARIREAHGVPVSDDSALREVLEEYAGGRDRGVRGSPHFFCGADDVFCPSLDISRDEGGAVHLARDMGALDAFLERCFAGDGPDPAGSPN